MNRFIFSNLNPDGTTSLFATDGTAAGTTDLQASRYGFTVDASVSPDLIDIAGDVLFVGSASSAFGNSSVIYRTDGTAIGTSEIVVTGTGGTLTPTGLWQVNGLAVASGPTSTGLQGLYASTDGVNFGAIGQEGLGVGPGGIIQSGGVSYFNAVDDSGNSLGLYRTDGTSAGTTLVSAAATNAGAFAAAGSNTVFTTTLYYGGTALWVTDGTSGGTAQLQVPGLESIYAESSLVSIGGRVLFLASDGGDAFNYATLWSTDGTVAGTTQITGFSYYGGGVNLNQSGVLSGLGKAVFLNGSSLYITDGTAVGTSQIPTPAQSVQQAVTLGTDVIYLGDANGLVSLFSFDAATGSTTAITLPSVNLSGASLTVVAGKVVFNAVDPSNVEAFYSTDGTQAGTTELTLPGTVSLNPTSPPVIGALPAGPGPSPGPQPPTTVLGGGDQTYSAMAGQTVLAGSGDDTVTASAGQVTVVGNTGTLAFVGGTGPSSVIGGGGSITILGGSGGGIYSGGHAGLNVLLSQGASGANTTLTGAGAGDQIFGSNAGNDVLIAGPGHATITGGNGHTTIQGGGAASVFFTGGGSNAVLGGAAGGDTIVGGAGNLNASAQFGDAIFGGSGVSNITGSKAGPGSDSIIGGSGALIVNGQGSNMLVVAGTSTSGIQVGNGASLIYCGSGDNTVIGGAGSLQMLLGSGSTTVTEGTGAATFQVQNGAAGGMDIINGYKAGTDHIDLYGYQPSGVQVTSTNGSSFISLSDGTKIQIVGVTDLGTSLVG